MKRGSIFLLGAMACLCLPAAPVHAIDPPPLVAPANGSIVQLQTGSSQILLRWGAVVSATGYVLNVEGPEGYIDLRDIEVEPAAGTVEFSIIGVVPGDYLWSVAAVNASESATTEVFLFTVQTPIGPGGDLPAPDLLQPPEGMVIYGNNARVTFQWARIPGAIGYQVAIEGGGGYLPLANPIEDGSTVRQTFQLTPGIVAGSYAWSVRAQDNEGLGEPSVRRNLLLLPELVPPRDLSFWLNDHWYSTGTVLDFDSNNRSDGAEALGLLPFQRAGEPISTGAPGPSLNSPPTNAILDRQNILFSWQAVPGARGYELAILSLSGTPVTSYFVAHPSTTFVQTTVPILPVDDYGWRVRAFFGSGPRATEYSLIRMFQAIVQGGKRLSSEKPLAQGQE
jgi:hypothetical protein